MKPQHTPRRLNALVAGILLSAYCGVPVLADDTEIFIGQGAVEGPEARPNILFILDTSGSMGDKIITQPTYVPTDVYDGACDASRVYFATGTTVPTCNGSNDSWFNLSALKCQAALNAFTSAAGFFNGRAQRFEDRAANANYRNWVNLSTNNATRNQSIECQADRGVHGDGVNASLLYARTATVANPTVAWGNSASEINWGGRTSYRLYTANYINWWQEYRVSELTKLEIMQDVSKSLIDQVSGVNIGLMRYDTGGQGGMVVHPVANVDDVRDALKSEIDGFNANGTTPLSETLYEAGRYWAGDTWVYGAASNPVTSVATSRESAEPTQYKSPLEYSCQKNYIVYLTDGLPVGDTDANDEIAALNGTNCGTVGGACLDDMAEFLFQNDQSSTLAGNQNVTTYTVGFDTDFPLLLETATKGGGSYYTANDTATLANAFTNIVQEILDTSATFTSPTVAVNAFNRTQNLNDLFITVFKPTDNKRWPGNLKKYRLDPITGNVEDANGAAAVDDTTGFFKTSAQSYWSAGVDGDSVESGGAASNLPDPATRNVYTHYTGSASTNLTNAANAFATANTAITGALLDVTTAGRPPRDNVIEWARGVDVTDVDGDGDTSEARLQMGDPLHSRPGTVIYGGTQANPDLDDAVVYAATNEGYVHAIDPSTGEELWSFIPDVMWPRLYELYENPSTSNKFYGVDGSMQILKIDVDQNGIVESGEGDKVYLYFGMRRGGNYYYALDVTDKDAPEFLWKNSSTELPGLGQSWSTPAVARVNVGGTVHRVLIFGGGYEEDQDPNSTTFLTSYSTDTAGNRIFMVDAVTGDLLWYAGGPGSGADLLLDGSSGKPTMEHSIPSDVRVIDLNSDGLADRMYAGDMGGKLWRFDITNGNAASSLVAGGVFASLGNAHEGTHPAASTRRFYSPLTSR